MIRESLIPIDLAASMYSFSRMLKIWPRTMRATSTHIVSPIAMNTFQNPAPKAKKSETKENSPAPTTKPAPTKPGTKPDTRPRPAHPGKNPNPGENPAPKAKKVSPENAKDKVIDVIMNLLKK